MMKGDLLCQIWCVLSVLGGVELRARGIIEDTGDPNWDAIASYLDYEEPEYNQSRGFTADDFTDHLQGYQTQPSIARSFGWEMPGYGEIPFAALLVSHEKTKYCMGTVITTEAVVTPCACVKQAALQAGDTPSDVWRHWHFNADDLYEFYHLEADLGYYFDVIANHIEYNEEHVGQDIYPHYKKIFSEKCRLAWSYNYAEPEGDKGLEGYKRYQQFFYPAIVLLSKKIEFDVACPWPPFAFSYNLTYSGSYYERGTRFEFFFNKPGNKGHPTPVISSFQFIPLEDSDLSMDNDARDVIQTKNRLVNLRVELCNQNLCNVSESFEKLNVIFSTEQILSEILCWCDVPWLGDEVIYQNMKNEEAPIYFKSVYGGLVGAPVVLNGVWLGWTTERVTREVSERTLRPILTRSVDSEMIAYFEQKFPELKNENAPRNSHPDVDVNRRSFAVHDLKDFVPDADIKEEDLDLLDWAQIGNPRFLKPKDGKNRRKKKSVASAILPTHVLSLLGISSILL